MLRTYRTKLPNQIPVSGLAWTLSNRVAYPRPRLSFFTRACPFSTSTRASGPHTADLRTNQAMNQPKTISHKNAFESLGLYPPLAANLASRMAIQEPTQLQRAFLPPILDGKDVLIRDTTGSGKTFGVLLSLLNKPRLQVPVPLASVASSSLPESSPTTQPGITSVVLVPNEELAFQLYSWTRSLFPSLHQDRLDELVQVVYTESLSLGDPEQSRSKSRPKDLNLLGTLENDPQVQKLATALPHVLVATPVRLWNLMQLGVLDLSRVDTVVLDEVDHLIRLPKRFASQRQIYNRDLHPKPAELAIREMIRSAKSKGRYSGADLDPKDRIQIVAASATMNRPMRYWLEAQGWIHDAVSVDTTKTVVLPEGIEHHCLIIGHDSIRNMKPESDGSQWGQKSLEVNGDTIDWATKDDDWKKSHLEGAQPGLDGIQDQTQAVETFGEDDDRMLEGVATACRLDSVKTACVFFCSSPSLSTIALRLEEDFGLSVHQIRSAFDRHTGDHSSTMESLAYQGQRKNGIFLAHENNARGLDLPGLSHVYIVGLPSSPSSYLHMAGRTGRMGQKGTVVTILRDADHLEDRARSLFNTLNVSIQPYSHVEQ